MQHYTYQHTTFHSTPYFTSHICISITPCLKLQHSTFHIAPCFTCTTLSHHISHRTIIHIKSLHHISAHHSTSRPHHAMHITTFKYKFLAISHISYHKFTPSPLALCHSPHYLVPHRTTFHIPCHSTHTLHLCTCEPSRCL